jgi:predicted anti-sigma-YlaC factor YlaD
MRARPVTCSGILLLLASCAAGTRFERGADDDSHIDSDIGGPRDVSRGRARACLVR